MFLTTYFKRLGKYIMRFDESSLEELYASAVLAFPKTTRRQHATDPIVIESLRWTPFIGLRTLFIKAQARNEERHYNPQILFKDVSYNESGVNIRSDGIPYQFAKLSIEHNDVLLRCDCKDFYWRFNYYNHLDKSLYGRKRAKYEGHVGPPANPKQLPGMCKHLMKMVYELRDLGVVK